MCVCVCVCVISIVSICISVISGNIHYGPILSQTNYRCMCMSTVKDGPYVMLFLVCHKTNIAYIILNSIDILSV